MSEFNEKKKEILKETTFSFVNTFVQYSTREQIYTYRVLQTIQMKLILLCVWAEPAVLGST